MKEFTLNQLVIRQSGGRGYQGRVGSVCELAHKIRRARVYWTTNPDGSDMGKSRKRTWVSFDDLIPAIATPEIDVNDVCHPMHY